MTVREALLSEIDRAPDEVLNVLLSTLRITHGQSQNQGHFTRSDRIFVI
jgi:MoxR-like ATPase